MSRSPSPSPSWDAGQYLRFADDRARPFADLVARIRTEEPATVVDLGCGPGTLTATLAQRWPAARVVGVDSSPQMIAAAGPLATGRVAFVRADLREWRPAGPVDVLVSNAALHWVPDHVRLFDRFLGWLTPGGTFAFQVPDNFAAPSHRLIGEVRDSPRWRDRLAGAGDAGPAVLPVGRYLAELAGRGLAVDAWQTTYVHVLAGRSPVLEWIRGTALRPLLARLDESEREEFCADLDERLAAAYPPAPYGTAFPFRRTFVVATKSPAAAG